jgi:hypothetical protein
VYDLRAFISTSLRIDCLPRFFSLKIVSSARGQPSIQRTGRRPIEALGDQLSDPGYPLQQVRTVGRVVQHTRQILPRLMKSLMATAHPEKTFGNIVDVAPVGDIGRPSFFTVETRKLLQGELLLSQGDPFLHACENKERGQVLRRTTAPLFLKIRATA